MRTRLASEEEHYVRDPLSAAPLLDEDDDEEYSTYSHGRELKRSRQWCNLLLISVLSTALVVLVVLLAVRLLTLKVDKVSTSCTNPSIRKEWRALTREERLEYLRAVKCLSNTPSKNLQNSTLHDEFAYIHMVYGEDAHKSASFLPWHRYYLHIYEKTLQEQCDYTGTLPYWDWTQDWQDITQALVWDAVEGFGGDGNYSNPTIIADGHCVQDGPFANLELQFFDRHRKPHCLARGFVPKRFRDKFGAHRVNKTAIANLLEEADYFLFSRKLEDAQHLTVPSTVRGDFAVHTGPNDPVFMIHHAQLDRLWWEWQLRDFDQRAFEIHGPVRTNSTTDATLESLIRIDGLAFDVPANLIMSSEDGILCYTYDKRA